MINLRVIGCGAAGNKAVAQMLTEKYIEQEDILLMNSNTGDIPKGFEDRTVMYGQESFGGSGKNREIGKKLLIEDLKNRIDPKFDLFCRNQETDIICIVASSEGGSGSSALPILSRYIYEVYGKYVIAAIFFGFEEDVRGLENSINICKELPDNIGVIGISNKKFIEECNGNKVAAERAANEYLIEALTVLSGKTIHRSDQNIDKTDLMKIITTPGYINVTMCKIGQEVKNKGKFNEAVKLAIDDARYLDSADRRKCHRIGIIYDLKDPESAENVDFSAEVLKGRYGVPYELFTHIQPKNQDDEYVTWIVTGQELPVQELSRIYNMYKENNSRLDKGKNTFFETISSFDTSDNDSSFSNAMEETVSSGDIKNNRKNFFESYNGGNSIY